MLNYNNIESAINYQRTPKTAIAKYLGIAESTLRNRLERKNLTPDDVQKIAEFLKKPMSYFFDMEDPIQICDPGAIYFHCKECIAKQKTIDEITAERDLLRVELLELYRSKKGQDYG